MDFSSKLWYNNYIEKEKRIGEMEFLQGLDGTGLVIGVGFVLLLVGVIQRRVSSGGRLRWDK